MIANALLNTARQIRHLLLTWIRAIGGYKWIATTSWRRQRLLILCYHGVSLLDEHKWHPELFVTPDFLKRRFEILRDGGYNILPLGEAVTRLKNGSLPPKSVALTFDDGYYDFYAAALPLLEEFGYPATVYVTTHYCLHQRPILGLALKYLLWRAGQLKHPVTTLPGHKQPFDLKHAKQRELLAARLLAEAKALSIGDRQAQQIWLAQLSERLGVDWTSFMQNRLLHVMNETEIADSARRGIDVQLHSHRHRTPRDETSFCKEILENRNILEKLTATPAIHYCYPSGDTDSIFLPWLRSLKVESATTCEMGLAKSKHDSLMLPRYIDTMGQTEVQFEGWLSGTAELLKWGSR